MAVITTSTFDPLKARVNVRLQQGVPIVDADWNEGDDIRKFELRAYLKWFVGEGIPDGSAAFRIDPITPTPAVDDCIIRAGVATPPGELTNYDKGLRFAGRAIVDGLDVIIPADIRYKAQPLFTAAAFGVPQIAPLPTAAGPIAVYLDVWERLITSQDDPSLVLPGIGTESCARMKREWCVRSRTGNVAPLPGDPTDFIAGHSYYLLAVITRRISGGNPAPIILSDVQDRRHLRLSLASMESRIAVLEQLVLLPAFVADPMQQFVPRSGTLGQQPPLEVTLRGKNFDVGTPRVTIGGVAAAISTGPPQPAATATTVRVVVPPSLTPGTYAVAITTDGGGPVTAATGFNVVAGLMAVVVSPPTFDTTNPFVPLSAPVGATVTIHGSNFDQPGLDVQFRRVDTDFVLAHVAPLSSSATQCTIQVPNIDAGAYHLGVSTNAGFNESPIEFNII
ncbi:MAG TPA: IPT/TIG domain-containing protein [Candidatus Limnocylindrales bacterium]|nr:IPT/TIG domain-containing protein [Candidatus Limnocylindrales bacterium]